MSLLEINNLAHAFGDNILFKNGEVVLNKGEHIGIVGQNGTGKSTFIKICTGQMIPDSGRVVWQKNVNIGYLDQYAEMELQMTMENFMKSAFSDLYEIEKKMNKIYGQAAEGKTDALEVAYQYQEELERKEFYMIDVHIQQIVNGLGLSELGLSRLIGEMSGGQRAKLILAKLLLEKPDVLLLDEPTNFLDKEHIEWLAEYLSGLDNAFMVVSHDYMFLEKIANRILDIDNYKITKYYGNYSEFLKKKVLLREDYVRQYTAQQKEIKKTEEFIRKNIAGRKSKMARGRRKQLERLDKMEALEQKEIIPVFRFEQISYTETEHLSVKNLSIGYYYPLLSRMNFSIKGGQKVVLTGFNGIGKSTLLKTLLRYIPELDGTFIFSSQVKVGYFSQDFEWANENMTPIQIVSDCYPTLTIKEVRKQLALCGVLSKHAMQPICTLSGGEQAKVKMCILTMRPCNFLILDEPTNHLDAQAKSALRNSLMDFNGTVLLVSHEEDFYTGWVDKIISIEKLVLK